jgi:uncharacterized membrane protein
VIKRTAVILGVAVMAAAITFVLLTGSGSSGPDPAACKAAMQKQFSYGMAHPGAPAGTRPDACKGVPDKDVQKFAGEIIGQYNGRTP